MLDTHKPPVPPLASDQRLRVAIAVSRYHGGVTGTLLKNCLKELKRGGLRETDVDVGSVPGAFELPYLCQDYAKTGKYAAVIALGCVVRGETPHFDAIVSATSHGIMEVSLRHHLPVVFGVLTTNTIGQAHERTHAGKHGDKGVEAAQTALAMITRSF